MKRSKLKLISISLFILVLVSSIFIFTGCPSKPKVYKITVLYMNDTHAHYVPYKPGNSPDETVGGFARAMTVIRKTRKSNLVSKRETILLHAGDVSAGTLYSTIFRGRMGQKLISKMKFDAMVVGNHEFDYGYHLLKKFKLESDLKILSANIVDEDGKKQFKEFFIKRFEGKDLQIIIFGLTTPTTVYTTHPKNVRGLKFLDPIETANKVLNQFHEEDLIIALTHLGVEDDKKLAESCPKIDLIVGGHSHTKIEQPLKINKTLICQAGAYAEFIGKLDIDVENGQIIKYNGELIRLTEEFEEDEKIANLIEKFKKKVDVRFEKKVAESKVFLDGEKKSVRSKETNLGKLICKIMRINVRADIALMNGGGIRASIQKGDIKLKDIYSVLPFDSTLVTINLKGKYLLEVLQRSADLKPGDGGKLHTYGITYTNKKGKIEILKIRKEPFDPEKNYKIALNNFIAEGGDGYTIFQEKGEDFVDTGLIIRDALIHYIRKRKVLTEEHLK